jgi:CHAT domain-containing protein/tetratricopeptide (TPR) repeat protein
MNRLRINMLAPFLAASLLVGPARGAEDAPSPEELSGRMEALAAQGDFRQAAEMATLLREITEGDSAAAAYEALDLGWTKRLLDAAAALDEQDRLDLIAANDLTVQYSQLFGEGRYEEALPLVERQLAEQKRLLGEGFPLIAENVHNAAGLLHMLGRYDESREMYEHALSLRKELLTEIHPKVALTLNGYARLEMDAGHYAEAETLFLEALRIRRALFGNDHADVGTALDDIGMLYEAMGLMEEARLSHVGALAIHRKALGEENINAASSLNSLGRLAAATGDYAASEAYVRGAIAIYRKVLGEDHPYTATALNNLGSLLLKAGDYLRAEESFREAARIVRLRHGEEHVEYAKNLDNLAFLRKAMGDDEEAEKLFRESLKLKRKTLGNIHESVAIALSNVAGVMGDRGDETGAEEILRESLLIYEQTVGLSHPGVEVVLSGIGSSLAAQGRYPEAKEAYLQAAEINRSASGDTNPLLVRIMENIGLTELAAGNLAGSEEALAEAARIYEAVRRRGENGVEREVFEASPYPALAASRLLRDKTDEAWDAAESALEPSGVGAAPEGPAPSVAAVQEGLDEGSAVIGWLDVEIPSKGYLSWIYVIRKSEPVRFVRVLPDPLAAGGSSWNPRQEVVDYRKRLAAPSSFHDAFSPRSHALWKERVEPVLEYLAGADRLIVIPSGAMAGLPLEALVDGDGNYLADRFTVSYSPSATVHRWLAQRAVSREASGSRRALFVGDLPLSEERVHETAASTAAYDAVAAAVEPDAAPSAGARTEIEGIAPLFATRLELLDVEASEENLLQLAGDDRLARFRVLHFATRGFADDERPEFSGLLLFQSGLPDPLESALQGSRILDGRLTAGEILREWRLEADLVTLSACETGRGARLSGEGCIGLAHAFFQAGASALLVSLWQVDEEATSLLMQRFYTNWIAGGMTKAAAVQEAKAWLRGYEDARGRRPYSDPYFWSPFILLGV